MRHGIHGASREARARACGRLIDALPQGLQPVHVDDGRGHGRGHAQHGGQQAEAAAQFDLELMTWWGVQLWIGGGEKY